MIFTVRVIPWASKSEIVGEYDEALKVKLSAPPVDGAANKELIKLLSEAFGVSKREVSILKGETSKTKTVLVLNASEQVIENLLKNI